jgi:acrylyl-CoA reductase (NADPH)
MTARHPKRHCIWWKAPSSQPTSWGEVLVRVRHSGINYKDALATGRGKVVRRVPLTLGIDAAGEVVRSADPRFTAGDRVVVTGHGLGEHHDGGWSELLRVPADWLDHLPVTVSTAEAMGIGTAGVTAALAVDRLQHAEVRPTDGPVAVTGASGAAGPQAVTMLAGLGYQVVAFTGSEAGRALLLSLGATAVEGRPHLGDARPLRSARWAGGIDCVGGDPLGWLLSTTRPEGTVVAFGNAAGNHLPVTVLPFILRGLALLGVNAADLPGQVRQHLWQRLSSDLAQPRWEEMLSVHPLDRVHSLVTEVLAATTTGRVVLDLG